MINKALDDLDTYCKSLLDHPLNQQPRILGIAVAGNIKSKLLIQVVLYDEEVKNGERQPVTYGVKNGDMNFFPTPYDVEQIFSRVRLQRN